MPAKKQPVKAAVKKVVAKTRPAEKKPAPKPASARVQASLVERAAVIHERLVRAQPEPVCELNHTNAWELVIATILSAQSTDRMVNSVTPELFRLYSTPAKLAAAPQETIEELVKRTGFFRNKAKAIREASRMIVERFGGEVPRTMEEITQLPGVARKTGNVVLGTAYRLTTGITVDTHAGRVARRLGLTHEDDPLAVEDALCALFPRDASIDTGHRFVLHGRYVCTARSPDCAHCPLNEHCPSAEADPEGDWQARADAERRRVDSRGAP